MLMHNCNLPAPYAALRLTGLSLLACFCVHPNTAAGADPSVRLVKEQSIKHASPGILGSLSDNQRWMIISSRADRRPDLWGMQDELWDGRRKRALKVQPSTGGLLKSQMDYRFLPKRSTALVSVRGDVEDYVRITIARAMVINNHKVPAGADLRPRQQAKVWHSHVVRNWFAQPLAVRDIPNQYIFLQCPCT